MNAILDYRLLESLGPWLDQWAQTINDLPAEIAAAALLLPLALAILSRRTLVFLGSFLLTGIVFVALARPALIGTAIALGAYVGSLIVALSGIVEFRRTRAIHVQLTELRQDVNQLQTTEARQYLLELKESRPVENSR